MGPARARDRQGPLGLVLQVHRARRFYAQLMLRRRCAEALRFRAAGLWVSRSNLLCTPRAPETPWPLWMERRVLLKSEGFFISRSSLGVHCSRRVFLDQFLLRRFCADARRIRAKQAS